MAPAATPKKKVGGLSPLMWGGVAVTGVIGIYLYRRMRASQAASANSGLPVGSGVTIPAGTAGGTTTGLQVFSTTAAWMQAAIAAMTGTGYSAAQAFNDLTAWTGGQCVSAAGYKAIGNIIETIGLPPGGQGTPTLTVCASSTPPPTGGTGGKGGGGYGTGGPGTPGGGPTPPAGSGASTGALASTIWNGFVYNLYQPTAGMTEQAFASSIYPNATPAAALAVFRQYAPNWTALPASANYAGTPVYIPNNPGEPVYGATTPAAPAASAGGPPAGFGPGSSVTWGGLTSDGWQFVGAQG